MVTAAYSHKKTVNNLVGSTDFLADSRTAVGAPHLAGTSFTVKNLNCFRNQPQKLQKI